MRRRNDVLSDISNQFSSIEMSDDAITSRDFSDFNLETTLERSPPRTVYRTDSGNCIFHLPRSSNVYPRKRYLWVPSSFVVKGHRDNAYKAYKLPHSNG